MKKYYWIWVFMLPFISTTAAGQDFQKDFLAAYSTKDTAATGQVLRRWYQSKPQDPDFYVARFNYLLKQGEAVELRRGNAATGAMTVKDKKGRTVGTLASGYLPDMVDKACAVLRQGLAISPERLDMWFGLAKTYEETHQAEEQVKTLAHALATHAASQQEWRWRSGAELPSSEAVFVPGALEQYAAVYWQQDQKEPLEFGRQLAELIVTYYPKSSLGPFNLGVYYLLTKQPRLAYNQLKQADTLQPDDQATVANLTKLAIELGNKTEAQRYLARLEKMPDAKEAASGYAKDLRKLK